LVRRNHDGDGRRPSVQDRPANSASCCSCIFIQYIIRLSSWNAATARLSRCYGRLRPFASCAHDSPGASLLAPDTPRPPRRGLWCVRDSRRSGHAGDWSFPADCVLAFRVERILVALVDSGFDALPAEARLTIAV
jgi:hypothetical protein